MIPKYTVEYATNLRHGGLVNHYSTDDPVCCEAFLVELLDKGYGVRGIQHEGLKLEGAEFDLLVKGAASQLASQKICASLGIKAEEERYRFGFAA